jgi:hypothetical protein
MANWNDVLKQARDTRNNVGDAAGAVGGAAFKMASGTKNVASSGVGGVAKFGSRLASNAASILLSAADGMANLAKKYPAVAAIVAVGAAITSAVTMWRGHKKKEEAQIAEAQDLQATIAANRQARIDLVAGKDGQPGLGALNPSNNAHAAATGRGVGVSQSA